MLFFDFQYVSMVYLVKFSTVGRTIVFSFVMLIPDVSLSNQNQSESGRV